MCTVHVARAASYYRRVDGRHSRYYRIRRAAARKIDADNWAGPVPGRPGVKSSQCVGVLRPAAGFARDLLLNVGAPVALVPPTYLVFAPIFERLRQTAATR
jgi:hypothetical protein